MKPTKRLQFNKNLLKKNNSSIDLFFSLLIFVIMIIIISNPTKYSNGTINGLNLFINSVLPGLFPFMFLTKLITELGVVFKFTQKCNTVTYKLFGTPGISLYVFIMSILSGYPIGAKIISDLFDKGLINEIDAKKMSIFCTTSGPIFIIGSVGTAMFGQFKIGIILYFSHIISSLAMGIIYHLLTKKNTNLNINNFQIVEITKTKNIFYECLSQTINSIFIVGAYITIFFLITELCETFKIISLISDNVYFVAKIFKLSHQECKSFVYGIFEVTRGCKLLSINPSISSISLCSGIISFSGLSIIMQSMSFLKITKIKMHSFVLTKLMHMILSIFLCELILIIFV